MEKKRNETNIRPSLTYRVFNRFRQTEVDVCGSILSLSQFLLLPHTAQKMKLVSKVVKIDLK
jgi:hypothetical protein